MNEINEIILMKLNEENEEHKYAIKKIKDYRFDKNYTLLRELSENESLCELNTNKLVGNGNKLYVRYSRYAFGVATVYIVDAFNVYSKSLYSNTYTKDIELTKRWRKMMKEAYPDSTYVEDARRFLKQELREQQDKLINEFNQQNIDLL